MYSNPLANPEAIPTPFALRRVLVVDDSRLQLKIISGILQKQGYEVVQAMSGQEALDICAQSPPDLVLSDWMMPGMDGLEFCRQFREMPREGYGYFILLTSKSEKGEIARGLDAGADDFLTKPVNSDELRARINAGARVIEMQHQLSAQNRVISQTLERLRALYDEIDRDLQQARTIQQALVPERTKIFETSRVSLLLKPCGHVGGDLPGMFATDYGIVGAYSIDVSGHGITSALVTARVAGYLSSRFPEQNLAMELRHNRYTAMRPAKDVAALLNQRLCADPGVAEYLTMAYVMIDANTGLGQLVQAGHPPPLLLRRDGTTEFIGDGGLPIGLVDEVSYDTIEFQMQSGDRLLMYTDGFSEAVLPSGEMLGEDGLLELARAVPHETAGIEYLDDLYWRLTQIISDETVLDDDVSATVFDYDVVIGDEG